MISRLLRRLDDPAGADPGSELRAFRLLVLVHTAVQAWAWVVVPLRGVMAMPRAGVLATASALSLCCGLSLTRWGRWAPVLALPALLWQHAQTFPATANHQFLALALVMLLAALDPERRDEGRLLLQGLRWVIAVVFFHAGFQKLLQGTWFGGEFLAWMIAHGAPAWTTTFAWLMPAGEVARLQALDGAVGAGPYRVASLPFALFSNGVYLAEMGLAVLLFLPRARTLAALAGIAMVFGIQLAPRELMFALLATQLFLLFLPGAWNRRLVWPIALAYAYLLAALAGWVPGELLLKPNGRL